MWRATLVLLLLAALSGAPSRASAAANVLADPTVTPASGSILETFTFSVRYDGSSPATSVTAAVAGLDLPMALADGSTTAGTWVASSALPAGAWGTTFIAYAEKGNVATVAGPALTVGPGDAVTLEPLTPETPGPPGPERQTETSREPVTDIVPPATPVGAPAQPVPSTGVESPPGAPSTPDPTLRATPASPVPASLATATDQPAVGGLAVPTGPAASPARPAAPAGGGIASGPTSITTPSAVAAADAADTNDSGQEESSIIVLVGLLGVGAVALIGTAMLVARRRRADAYEESAATTAAAALQRRSVRRARLRMGEDPIMAAMGLGAEVGRKVRSRPPPIDEDQA